MSSSPYTARDGGDRIKSWSHMHEIGADLFTLKIIKMGEKKKNVAEFILQINMLGKHSLDIYLY